MESELNFGFVASPKPTAGASVTIPTLEYRQLVTAVERINTVRNLTDKESYLGADTILHVLGIVTKGERKEQAEKEATKDTEFWCRRLAEAQAHLAPADYYPPVIVEGESEEE